jgi:hypothetical protein
MLVPPMGSAAATSTSCDQLGVPTTMRLSGSMARIALITACAYGLIVPLHEICNGSL